MQENLAWAPGSVREQRDSDCVVCWRDATWANSKVSAALGESPSEMLLDVGSNPTASTNMGSGHDWPGPFVCKDFWHFACRNRILEFFVIPISNIFRPRSKPQNFWHMAWHFILKTVKKVSMVDNVWILCPELKLEGITLKIWFINEKLNKWTDRMMKVLNKRTNTEKQTFINCNCKLNTN